MKYKFEKEKKNYSLFASGSVLFSFAGQPAFPLRLTSEIYQRCEEILKRTNLNPPYSVYDPFCGSGYLITSLGFLHGNQISSLTGSDINNDAVNLTNRNLSLLSFAGLSQRRQELIALYRKFNKDSHLEATEKVTQLIENYLTPHLEKIVKYAFQADALSNSSIESNIKGKSIDIVISDIPYGNQTKWILKDELINKETPVVDFLATIKYFVKPKGLVVLAAQHSINFSNIPDFFKINHFKIGHRHIYISQLID